MHGWKCACIQETNLMRNNANAIEHRNSIIGENLYRKLNFESYNIFIFLSGKNAQKMKKLPIFYQESNRPIPFSWIQCPK